MNTFLKKLSQASFVASCPILHCSLRYISSTSEGCRRDEELVSAPASSEVLPEVRDPQVGVGGGRILLGGPGVEVFGGRILVVGVYGRSMLVSGSGVE